MPISGWIFRFIVTDGLNWTVISRHKVIEHGVLSEFLKRKRNTSFFCV